MSEERWQVEYTQAMRRDMRAMAEGRRGKPVKQHYADVVQLAAMSLWRGTDPVCAAIYLEIMAVHSLLDLLQRCRRER